MSEMGAEQKEAAILQFMELASVNRDTAVYYLEAYEFRFTVGMKVIERIFFMQISL